MAQIDKVILKLGTVPSHVRNEPSSLQLFEKICSEVKQANRSVTRSRTWQNPYGMEHQPVLLHPLLSPWQGLASCGGSAVQCRGGINHVIHTFSLRHRCDREPYSFIASSRFVT